MIQPGVLAVGVGLFVLRGHQDCELHNKPLFIVHYQAAQTDEDHTPVLEFG